MGKKILTRACLVIGIAICVFGLTGLFVEPVAGVIVMVIGAALTLPYFIGKKKDTNNKHPETEAHPTVANPVQPPLRPAPAPATSTTTENHRVAGVTHYQDAILELALETEEYDYSKKELEENGFEDEKVWKYEFDPSRVELVEQPDNPHDPKAIKVMIDGVHVGYIKSGSCAHVKNLLDSGRIQRITADITGGPYKLLYFDDYEDKYELEKGERGLSIEIHIILKP